MCLAITRAESSSVARYWVSSIKNTSTWSCSWAASPRATIKSGKSATKSLVSPTPGISATSYSTVHRPSGSNFALNPRRMAAARRPRSRHRSAGEISNRARRANDGNFRLNPSGCLTASCLMATQPRSSASSSKALSRTVFPTPLKPVAMKPLLVSPNSTRWSTVLKFPSSSARPASSGGLHQHSG